MPDPDPVPLLLGRGSRSHVRRLIVGGKMVVEGGRCTRVDLAAHEAELTRQARMAWPANPPDLAALSSAERAIALNYQAWPIGSRAPSAEE